MEEEINILIFFSGGKYRLICCFSLEKRPKYLKKEITVMYMSEMVTAIEMQENFADFHCFFSNNISPIGLHAKSR